MKTELHLKLESVCRRMIKEPKHWFVTGTGVMWLPEVQDHVSVKRAIYAAFIEDVPGDMEVRTTKCEASKCVNPYHCSLVPARGTGNKPLSFPWHREQLSAPKRFVPPTPKGKLPVGVTPEMAARVKTMTKAGSTLAQIQLVVGIDARDIVSIRNGVYDRALGRAKRKAAIKAAENVVLPPLERQESLVVPAPIFVEEVRSDDEEFEPSEDSDEQIWLNMMRNK